tara:strand:- start:359 stop:694 length:336 start_codon:yes stop_codon:yes gene_type:complete
MASLTGLGSSFAKTLKSKGFLAALGIGDTSKPIEKKKRELKVSKLKIKPEKNTGAKLVSSNLGSKRIRLGSATVKGTDLTKKKKMKMSKSQKLDKLTSTTGIVGRIAGGVG